MFSGAALRNPQFLHGDGSHGGPGDTTGPPRSELLGGPVCCGGSGQRKRTFTCSSLPPSEVFATVSEVPVPATLVEAHGFAELQ